MKKYQVVLHPDAELDIESSFKWGCRRWGHKNAQLWVRELHHAFRNQLRSMPCRCPVAPESEELGVSVRNLIIGRYRILFVVEGSTVTVLHEVLYNARWNADDATSKLT